MNQLESRMCLLPSLFRSVVKLVAVVLIATFACLPVLASDHSDAPQSGGVVRQDANLADLYAFVVESNLVIALCSNPAIPKSASGYVFPTDVTFEINIDHHSAVSGGDPFGMGGTIVDPDKIREDITFRIRFQEDGTPRVQTLIHGSHKTPVPVLDFFAGLRDDPFIRGPRQSRNIASIVLEVPLAAVARGQGDLLIWATSKVDDFDKPFQDLAGRSLRSMMPENAAMDTLHPRAHTKKMGVTPDVMIYSTALPAAFPNGRALADDVVDLVGDSRVLNNDAPFPSTNDLPFLTTFPYLALPHPPQ